MTVNIKTIVVKPAETRDVRDTVTCDGCGDVCPIAAVTLARWLTLVLGAYRIDGGGHEDDKDFCSPKCLREYVKDRSVSYHPYRWQ